MSEKRRGAERGPSRRLRFEGEVREPLTSGQVGPKSKRRFSIPKDPEPPPIPDASPPVEDTPATSGHVGPKLDYTPEHGPTDKAASRRLRFEDDNGPGASPHSDTSGQVGPKLKHGGKLKQDRDKARPSERLRRDGEAPPPDDGGPAPDDGSAADGGATPDSGPGPADKKAARDNKRFDKSKRRADRSGAKLDNAREKLAAQKPPKRPGIGKTIGRAAKYQAWRYVHGKIHQIEHENVGIEAAHKTELAGEKVVRGTTRFVKKRIRTHPARRVRKWEKRDIKAKADLQFRTMAREHPEINKNALSRFWQKRRLKKKYQKQAREAAKQGARAAKKTAVTTEKIAGAVVRFVKSNPKVILIGACLFLLIVILQSCMAALTSIGNGIVGVAGGTSYLSTDSDIETVEVNYTALETALREKLARIESDYPSYDEYRYSVDEIGHDPFELASYLTAKYDDYTPAEVQAELQFLLEQQYTLTITETVEVRYRTETRTDTWTDSEGNSHSDTYTVEVPYNYYILNVTLRNKSLGAVALANLDPVQTERYLVYQQTKGNRPYLFEGNIYVHPGEYTDYDIPPEALSDPAFAELIAEAEKYLGYPYVWGGSKPSTSFDCSGFVCWVINQSGVGSVGRTTATGLFNGCAAIPPSEAKPGDLIFFTGTYDSAGPVSHVGIYVGNNMMLHCASGGVQYARTDTKYWTEHFYAMGRL